MSLQYRWAERFLNRQDPWILQPQREHLENLTAEFQSALNALSSSPDQAVAALSQKLLHPFCHLNTGSQPLAQGSAASAARLLTFVTNSPGRRVICPVAFHRARDCKDNWECVVQENEICLMAPDGAVGNPSKLTLVWKPMTNGEWRLFLLETTATLKPETLGFKRTLNI